MKHAHEMMKPWLMKPWLMKPYDHDDSRHYKGRGSLQSSHMQNEKVPLPLL
jgi:hypothetical protein